MRVLVRTGFAGCVCVNVGPSCRATVGDLACGLAAVIGLPPSKQNLFFGSRKLTNVDDCLRDISVHDGDAVDLQLGLVGGMLQPSSLTGETLEEIFAEGAPPALIDSISECLFCDPVISTRTGRTFSRLTIQRNNMVDPMSRDRLTESDLIPNRDKAMEVEAFLDARLREVIGGIDKLCLGEVSTALSVAKLITAVAYRDVTAANKGKRLLVEMLQSTDDRALTLFRTHLSRAQLSGLTELLRFCTAKELALRLGVDDAYDAAFAVTDSDNSESDDFSDVSSISSAGSTLADKKCMWVGNLALDVTEEMLSDIFHDYKPYVESIVVPSSGADKKRKHRFAFVTFANAEIAEEALGQLSTVKFHGKPLKLDLRDGRKKGKAKKKERVAKSSMEVTKEKTPGSIKVTFLDQSTTDDDLRSCFGQFGEVMSVNIRPGKPSKHAFVNFAEKASANTAVNEMDCKMLKGSKIRVKLQQGDGISRPPTSQYTVKVKGIHPDVVEQDLHDLFSQYGAIQSLKLNPAKGQPSFAYVNFATRESAAKASSELHGKEHFSSVLCVRFQDGKASGADVSNGTMSLALQSQHAPSSPKRPSHPPVPHSHFPTGMPHGAPQSTHPSGMQQPPGGMPHGAPQSTHPSGMQHPPGGMYQPGVFPPPAGGPSSYPMPPPAAPSSSAPPLFSPPRPGEPVPLPDGTFQAIHPMSAEVHSFVRDRFRAELDSAHRVDFTTFRWSSKMATIAGRSYESVRSLAQLIFLGVEDKIVKLSAGDWKYLTAIHPLSSMSLFQERHRPLTSNPDVMINQLVQICAIQFIGKLAAVDDAMSFVLVGTNPVNISSGGTMAHSASHSTNPGLGHLPGLTIPTSSGPFTGGGILPPAMPAPQPFMSPAGHPLPPSSDTLGHEQPTTLPVNAPLMDFLLQRCPKLAENTRKDHSVEIEGLAADSKELRFVGGSRAQQHSAWYYVKETIKGVVCRKLAMPGMLVIPARHAMDAKKMATTVYCEKTTNSQKDVSVTICGLGEKPINQTEQFLKEPMEIKIDLQKEFFATLRSHPQLAPSKLRDEHHIAFVERANQGIVLLRGYIQADLDAVEKKLTDFIDVCETVETLQCSAIQQQYLIHALYTLRDTTAQSVISDIEKKHDVKLDRTDDNSHLVLKGAVSSVRKARQEILDGPLLSTFTCQTREPLITRAVFNPLIKKLAIALEEKYRVTVFTSVEEVQVEAAAGPKGNWRGSSQNRPKTQLKIVIDVCGVIPDEVEEAFKEVEKVEACTRVARVSPAEKDVLDHLLGDGTLDVKRIEKNQGVKVYFDRQNNQAYLNGLSQAATNDVFHDLRGAIDGAVKSKKTKRIDNFQLYFLEHKRREQLNELDGVEWEFKKRSERSTDGLHHEMILSGSRRDVRKANDQVDELLQAFQTKQVEITLHRGLDRMLQHRCHEIKKEVEDSLDVTVFVPHLPKHSHEGLPLSGSVHGGKHGSHHGAAGARSKDDTLTCKVSGVLDDEVGQAVDMLKSVNTSVIEYELQSTEKIVGDVKKALREKKLNPREWNTSIHCKSDSISFHALSDDDLSAAREAVQAFTEDQAFVREQFKLNTAAIGFLVCTTQWTEVTRLAKVCSAIVKQPHRKVTEIGTTEIIVQGKRTAVDKLKADLGDLASNLERQVAVNQMTVEGLYVSSLLEPSIFSQIAKLQKETGVLCTWPKLTPQKAAEMNHPPVQAKPTLAGAMPASPPVVPAAVATGPMAIPVAANKWYFRDDKNEWSECETEYSNTLNQARAYSQKQCQLSRGQWTYTVDLNVMQQVNTSTGKIRDIKCEASQASSQPSVTTSASVPDPVVVDINLPYSVTVELEGFANNIEKVKTKLDAILKASIVEQDVKNPGAMTPALKETVAKVCRKIGVELVIKEETSSVAANFSIARAPLRGGVFTIRGVCRRVNQCVREVQSVVIEQSNTGGDVDLQLPDEWEPQTGDLELKQVVQHSAEWMKVEQRMRATLPSATVHSIARIQNKWLWERYVLAQQRLKKKNGNADVNEKWLFHGTRQTEPKQIYQNEEGFDMRFSAVGMWGRGNYFAVNSQYSHNYAHTNSSTGQREMFLAKVMAGDACDIPPDGSLIRPPIKMRSGHQVFGDLLFDTVTGQTGGSQVYITYSNEKAYPFYLITYSA